MATVMPGVLNKTLSQIWLNWSLPIFLFRVGLFTLMKIDSLINLVKSCPSLPIILKLSWVVWCPISWLCACIREGPLRCSQYLSPVFTGLKMQFSQENRANMNFRKLCSTELFCHDDILPDLMTYILKIRKRTLRPHSTIMEHLLEKHF